MSRDFTYVDDIVNGVYKTIITDPQDTEYSKKRFRIYNIGNSKPINLEYFISTIEKLTGKTANKQYLSMQPGDVKATWADTTLLHNDYNYSPDTPVEKGLEAFIGWYKEFYNK